MCIRDRVEEFPRQTNVSLATEGGKFYTFNVDYRQQPEAFVYEMSPYVTRLRLMWENMRDKVVELFLSLIHI